ncbi:MAG: ECF transporter S component [Butyrivibrio sp.]|nr:ECF transporter S component [Butyrivibrio sp.]
MTAQTSIREETAHADNRAKDLQVRKIVFTGIFAAITYVVFAFLSIKVPTPGGQVSIHLGNAFAALGALLLGSLYGGIGGALGLTIADLIDPVYIVEAPITFVIKLLMGLLVGFIAHHLFHISTEHDHAKVIRATVLAVLAGMVFNALVDPTLRYLYKILILGRPAAEVSFAINFSVTVLNSVVSTVLTVVLYLALRTPLKKAGLLFEN